MINIGEVIETNDMVEKENLDVRTITLGISLLDCIDSDLAKVKTKFYKANHTRRGSGIGLAVADEIIAMHGGKMDVFSAGEGKGTTVTISLPAKNNNS